VGTVFEVVIDGKVIASAACHSAMNIEGEAGAEWACGVVFSEQPTVEKQVCFFRKSEIHR
jgi:hypothetical protein